MYKIPPALIHPCPRYPKFSRQVSFSRPHFRQFQSGYRVQENPLYSFPLIRGIAGMPDMSSTGLWQWFLIFAAAYNEVKVGLKEQKVFAAEETFQTVPHLYMQIQYRCATLLWTEYLTDFLWSRISEKQNRNRFLRDPSAATLLFQLIRHFVLEMVM